MYSILNLRIKEDSFNQNNQIPSVGISLPKKLNLRNVS